MNYPSIDAAWSEEKAGNVVRGFCRMLIDEPRLKDDIQPLLHDALVIYVTAVSAFHGGVSRFSPDLVRRLLVNPEQCASILEEVNQPDYQDDYYERHEDPWFIPTEEVTHGVKPQKLKAKRHLRPAVTAPKLAMAH